MSPKSKTVLVDDHDEGMRDTLTAILKRSYRVLTAETGEEGLADDRPFIEGDVCDLAQDRRSVGRRDHSRKHPRAGHDLPAGIRPGGGQP